MRRGLLAALALLTSSAPLAAQSSVFGVRGLGQPGRGLSVAALGMAGAGGMFDGRSIQNPAALGLLGGTALAFTSTQVWRNTETDAGTGATREHRFPHFLIGGPIPGSPVAAALSYSSYAVRDFTLVSAGVDAPRGVPVAFTDSVGSTGGINDLRAGVAWTVTPRLIIGGGVHLITGSNRIFSVRAWEDSAYLPLRQSAELTYTAGGVSAGVVYQPTSRLHLGATIRADGALHVERDSVETGSVSLPLTIAGGARYRVSDRMAIAGSVTSRDWARANAGIVDLGGVGAEGTLDVAGGVEIIRNVRRPEHLPIRVGIRRAELPFLLQTGAQPTELGLAIGTGFRFSQDLGGIDLALERVRRTQGDAITETAWQFSLGVSLRGFPNRR